MVTRGKGCVGQVVKGKGGQIYADRRWFGFEWWARTAACHTVYCTDHVSLKCTTETYTVLKVFYWLIWEKEGEEREKGGEERERERHFLSKKYCCSTYLCIHWLILVCALMGDQTCNLGVSGWCSNQLSYLARAETYIILLTNVTPINLNLFLKR